MEIQIDKARLPETSVGREKDGLINGDRWINRVDEKARERRGEIERGMR